MKAILTRIAALERKAEDAITPESVPVFFLPPDNEAERLRQEAEIAELEAQGKPVIVFAVMDMA